MRRLTPSSLVIFIVSLMIIGMVAADIIQKAPYSQETEAVITKVEPAGFDTNGGKRGVAYVTFTANGEEYRNICVPGYMSHPREGEAVKIVYKPDSPGTIALKSEPIIRAIFMIIGALLFAVGLATSAGHRKERQDLLHNPTSDTGVLRNE